MIQGQYSHFRLYTKSTSAEGKSLNRALMILTKYNLIFNSLPQQNKQGRFTIYEFQGMKHVEYSSENTIH